MDATTGSGAAGDSRGSWNNSGLSCGMLLPGRFVVFRLEERYGHCGCKVCWRVLSLTVDRLTGFEVRFLSIICLSF